jgi:hypothetical protein
MTPAIDEPTAARILGLAHAPHSSRSRALASFVVILALAAHAAIGGGFPDPAQSAAMSPTGASPPARESAHMKRLMAIGAAAAVASGASAQNTVQWRVEDGGNGHWYSVLPESVLWPIAKQQCESVGGHLATLTSEAENTFAAALVGPQTGWIGAFQPPDTCEPGCGWAWVTGEPWVYQSWAPPAPNENGPEDFGETYSSGGWNDMPATGWLRRGLIEWSADCNSDGIVDYGQIRTGELADANTNNIPDCCENATPCGCAGDTNLDASVDGIDLATVLTRWAQPAAKFPEADCNRDGVIDGADLAIVLGSWGACP